MNRSVTLAALALALAVGGVACTKAKGAAAGARLRQPEAVAVFQGKTLHDPNDNRRPYLVIANASRNDLAIVDAATNVPVASPIKLRTLVIPVSDRPSLLASASLGDGKPDLLVVVSAGDSVLQVVETWDVANLVHSADGLAADLGHDVVALAPLPFDPQNPGSVRIAAALAERRVAVVEYRRDGSSDAIVPVPTLTIGPTLPFQPEAVAAMPDDPDVLGLQTELYVATRDALDFGDPNAVPPIPPTYGVAELSPADLSVSRILDARAPTRLVAAARLQERLSGSAASDTSAFDATRVQRVYAVLDESSCGPGKPIDCGVVALDPVTQAIPPDYAGLMPYRAPMRVPGRPLAIAVSGPPAVPLDTVANDPVVYPAGFMRIYTSSIGRATTAVAAVPSDDGKVYFLDLGRFETETTAPAVSTRTDGTPKAGYGYPPQEDPTKPPDPTITKRRIWIQDATGAFVNDTDASAKLAAVTTTPGFTPSESWSLRWEGTLPDLGERVGEVGTDTATSQLFVAFQVGDRPAVGPRTFTQVVRLWHPALGVRKNDILVIPVAWMPAPGCEGTKTKLPFESTAQVGNAFEVRIGDLLPPSDEHPGGALSLVRPGDADPKWQACYDLLSTKASGKNVVTGLRVTVRAQGLVLSGTNLGYLGRPELGDPTATPPAPKAKPYALQYPATPAEDLLVAACPLADWDGSYPAPANVMTCDDTCRDECEKLVLARKARRHHNISVDCATNPNPTTQATCEGNWPPATYPFPVVNGPAFAFQVAVQSESPTGTTAPFRDMVLAFTTSSGAVPWFAQASGTAPQEASGAISFDRTPWTAPADGYRFYISYPSDFVLDATPSQSGTNAPAFVIR